MHYVGIDLGTTNCSLAVSTGTGIEDISIYQAVGEDLFDRRIQLPSFFYLPEGEQRTRFEKYPSFSSLGGVCGMFARELAVKEPSRVIQSAKSWISLSNENSTNKILPFAPDPTEEKSNATKVRLSPIEAQAKYLQHIREQSPEIFEDANVVVTVPASFDERARNLTLESARMAGIGRVTLLEEPQAAFYDWLYYQNKEMDSGSNILVVDIGGGTTDFSLLSREKGKWKRTAVGEHLLLGGDNIDLALAYSKEKELGGRLDSGQWIQLLNLCRDLKEDCLDEKDSSAPDREFSLIGTGSSLFGSEIKVRFQALEVKEFILNGFFPLLDSAQLSGELKGRDRDLGLREFGLPYEKNPEIPIHLIKFLKGYCPAGPDTVLFHGGTVKSHLIRERILQNLEIHYGRKIKVLGIPHPYLGVSHGACIYALARDGLAEKIQSGLAHNLYLEVERPSQKSAFYCVAQSGQEESQRLVCPAVFQLKGNQEIRFPLFRSRAIDSAELGEVLESDNTRSGHPQLISLAPVYSTLPATDNFFPVQVSTELASTGELKMDLCSTRSDESFELSFHHAAQKSQQKILKVPPEIEDLFQSHFGKGIHGVSNQGKQGPRGILKRTETILQTRRLDWGVDLCRLLAKVLIGRQKSRRKSEIHEQVWLNAVGFLLRPGFGHPLDKGLFQKLDFANFTQYPKIIQNRLEYWIFLRRISGGISEEFQNTLFESYGNYLFGKAPLVKLAGGAPTSQELREMTRCFASFEYLEPEFRQKLFRAVLQTFAKKKLAPEDWWIFSRLLSRQMQYADFTRCLPAVFAHKFFEEVIRRPRKEPEMRNVLNSLFSQTADRSLAFDEGWTEKLSIQYELGDQTLEPKQAQRYCFGESLPLGLKLLSTTGHPAA